MTNIVTLQIYLPVSFFDDGKHRG